MKRFFILLALVAAPLAYAEEITFQWDPPADATNVAGYELMWGTVKGGPYPIKVDVGNVLTGKLNRTNPEVGFSTVVRAYNAGKTVWSPVSNEVTYSGYKILAPGNYCVPPGCPVR